MPTKPPKSPAPFVIFNDKLYVLDRISGDGQIGLEDPINRHAAFAVRISAHQRRGLTPASADQVKKAFRRAKQPLPSGFEDRCGVSINEAVKVLRKK
jgi:hypothetical protein